MPEASTPTVRLTFALPPAAWEAAQASVTGADAPNPPPFREAGASAVAEFALVDVAVGAETLRLEGPGATLAVYPDRRFRLGGLFASGVAFVYLDSAGDSLTVGAPVACAFLGFLRNRAPRWEPTGGTAALRALYEADAAIPEAALAAMAAAGPAPGPTAAPGHDGGAPAEPTAADGEAAADRPESPTQPVDAAEEHPR